MARFILPLIIAAAILSPANAGHPCGQFFVAKQHAVALVAPVYAAPVYYQAGRDLEADALAEKVARLVAPRLIEQFRASVSAPQRQTSSAVAQHCGKCHSGANPKGGVSYDGSDLLCRDVTGALRAIANGSMPKDKKLTPEQKGELMQNLLDLEQPADKSPAVPVPTPEPGELR